MPTGSPKATLTAAWLAGAVALVAPSGDSQAQSRIGRLFSSPEQRAELDRLREESDAGDVATPASDPPEGASPRGTELATPALAATLNGILVRGDGHSVAWIDGIETLAGASTPAGVRVETEHAPDGRLHIRLSLGPGTAVLAPGQSIDADGTVRNAYERHPGTVAAGKSGEGTSDAPTPGGEWMMPGNETR